MFTMVASSSCIPYRLVAFNLNLDFNWVFWTQLHICRSPRMYVFVCVRAVRAVFLCTYHNILPIFIAFFWNHFITTKEKHRMRKIDKRTHNKVWNGKELRLFIKLESQNVRVIKIEMKKNYYLRLSLDVGR